MADFLEFDRVYAGYGEGTVLDGCSFTMAEGESLALLGRNGVGKSTLLATLMGHTRVHRGSIRFRGADLVAVAAYRRSSVGLGWVPQEREIFSSLSVEENLTVTALPGKWDLSRVYELFPALQERRKNWGNELSGGEQQMLAIGRALMLNPQLLLLDEPLEGLAPVIIEQLCAAISRMSHGEGQALVLVEQHVEQALSLTDRCLVLERGSVVHAGLSQAQLADLAQLEKWVGIRLN
jgi:branched-chain amino acid transport system ATP-binding protein